MQPQHVDGIWLEIISKSDFKLPTDCVCGVYLVGSAKEFSVSGEVARVCNGIQCFDNNIVGSFIFTSNGYSILLNAHIVPTERSCNGW